MSILDIRPALIALLSGDADVAVVVDWATTRANGGQRIFPGKLPQGTVRPSVVYNRVSGQGDHHMEGPSGLTSTRFQVDSWAQTLDAAASLANLVKAVLDGFSGTVAYGSNSPQDSIYIGGVFYDTEREDYDDVPKLNRMSRDYVIWFNERP